jgi:hypothetical protein
MNEDGSIRKFLKMLGVSACSLFIFRSSPAVAPPCSPCCVSHYWSFRFCCLELS